MPIPPIHVLVAEGAKLKNSITESTKRLKEIEGILIVEGVGDYEDNDGHKAKVIQPADSVAFPSSEEDRAKVKEIAGEAYSKLFDRVVSYKPVKAFENVASALLKKGPLGRILKLCAKSSTPYVKWA